MFFAQRRLKHIEEELERLQRDFKGLRMEWDDAYDKLRTLTARFTKRAEAIEKARAPQGAEGVEENVAHGPTLDPVSARILARRAKLFERTGG